jgi:alkanesulfonate monooxygenase SsuD/methylene tetrahydromethanopterin reductase-like flavin-dependent oxidoreductase (luciferase family)
MTSPEAESLRAPAQAAGRPGREVRAGVLIWSQFTAWQDLMRAAGLADSLGYDDIWSWDHLVPIKGDPEGPIFEGFMTLAGWAATTRRARLGIMVAANTFRSPTIVVKMVTALDHMTGGRAILGMGAGWFEPEHTAFGFPFGASAGERLGWLDEAAAVVRALLDDEAASARGPHYTARAVRNRPPGIQARIPLLIGGGGERKTLATVARYADMWNIGDDLELARSRVAALDGWCSEVGRDPLAIERTLGVGPVVIRESAREGRAAIETLRRHNPGWTEPLEVMGVGAVIDRLAPYLELGFRSFHIDLPAPFDVETLGRFAADVRPALARAACDLPPA